MLQRYIRNLALVFASAAILVVLFLFWESAMTDRSGFDYISINAVVEQDLSDEELAVQKSTADSLKSALRSAVTVEDPSAVLLDEKDAVLIAYRDSQTVVRYDLYVMSVAQKLGYLYDEAGNHLYRLSADGFVTLGQNAAMKSYFTYSQTPQMSIVSASEKAVSGKVTEGFWAYAEPDGYYTQRTLSAQQTEIMQLGAEDVVLVCDVVPDRILVTVTDEDGKVLMDQQPMSLSDPFTCFESGEVYQVSAEVTWDKSIQKDYYGNIIYKFSVGID